jgi:hypothetical protein
MQVGELKISSLEVTSTSSQKTIVKDIGIAKLFVDQGKFTADSFQSKSEGLDLTAKDIEVSKEVFKFKNLTGEVRPELVPMLLKPFDFSAHGSLALTDQKMSQTHLEGTFLGPIGHFTNVAGKLHLTTLNFNLSEFFKTFLPLAKLNLNLQSEGPNRFALLDHAMASYHVRLCERQFLANGNSAQWSAPASPVAQTIRLRFAARNLNKIDPGIFAKTATLDDYLLVLLSKEGGSPKAMDKAAIAEFCNTSSANIMPDSSSAVSASFENSEKQTKASE